MLVCPLTKAPVRETTIEAAERAIGASIGPCPRTGASAKPIGRTPTVLLRSDNACAFPILDGLPVLLAPEMLAPAAGAPTFDLRAPQYEEAFEEMDFYNGVAGDAIAKVASGGSDWYFTQIMKLSPEERRRFPNPRSAWIDAPYDCKSQWDAYRHIGPVTGKVVVQLGGSGIHTVKFLLAGAKEGWLLTPMPGELRYARALAARCGVLDRFKGVIAVGEELPFADASVDAMYSGGCVHHMETEKAMPEFNRVLGPGGRFAAVDPWKAPLYTMGIKIFGKREKNVHCRPIDDLRLAPLFKAFPIARAVRHGAFTRYPLLALQKLGLPLKVRTVWQLFTADDLICSLIPPLGRFGSSIALLGSKAPA